VDGERDRLPFVLAAKWNGLWKLHRSLPLGAAVDTGLVGNITPVIFFEKPVELMKGKIYGSGY
jgi:hypothetical protein